MTTVAHGHDRSQGSSLASMLVRKAITRAAVTPYAQKATAAAVSATCGIAEPLLELGNSSSSRPLKPTKEETTMIRSFAAKATCGLLCACALAAGIDARAVANMLLLHLYGAIKFHWGFHVVEGVLVPFVMQFCGPKEWIKCSAACRKFKDLGVGDWRKSVFWMQGFCREGRAEVLELAVQQNVPTLVRPILAARADVNFAFEHMWCRTPLHRAAMRGNTEMCRLLLQLRADLRLRDSHGAAPIHLAASRGRLPTLDLLLRIEPEGAMAVDTNGRTSCHMAALKGHVEVIKMLLRNKASIDAQDRAHRTPADMARRGQFWPLVKMIEELQEEQQQQMEQGHRVEAVLP